ncbi:hypothetical protein AB0P07_08275 [Streptomyces sp. NPDC085944]|uniref:hypothetical protein n=1 Tax=Streptomyces sp. NPDC085944 TaxID=3154962 RepID=UPI0034360CA1
MRIRITLDIRTTPRASTTPPTHDGPPTVDATPTPNATPTEAAPGNSPTPFGFSLDGTSLGSDTERAEPYDDSRGAEYEDNDAHKDGRQ